MLLNVTAILIGYLLGSIPSAYIAARLSRGIDIREVGVGNMGAANTFREVGRRKGIIVWAADVAKGAAAIFVALALGVSEPWVMGAGFAALLGHSFPVYIGFKGGKGASTTMGVFLVLAPEAMAITFALMAIPYLITRRVFIAICFVSPILPLLIWRFEGSTALIVYSIALVVFMGLRNIPSPDQFRAIFARKSATVTEHYDGDNSFPHSG